MKNLFSPEKKVQMSLVGLDGNAFSLMGAFSACARIQGWTKEEIKVVLDECMSGDYDHLLQVLIEHTEEEGIGDTTEEEDDPYTHAIKHMNGIRDTNLPPWER